MWGVTAELERRLGLRRPIGRSVCDVTFCCPTAGVTCFCTSAGVRTTVCFWMRFHFHTLATDFSSQALLFLPALKCHMISSQDHTKAPRPCDLMSYLEAQWLRMEKQDCHLLAKIFSKQSKLIQKTNWF